METSTSPQVVDGATRDTSERNPVSGPFGVQSGVHPAARPPPPHRLRFLLFACCSVLAIITVFGPMSTGTQDQRALQSGDLLDAGFDSLDPEALEALANESVVDRTGNTALMHLELHAGRVEEMQRALERKRRALAGVPTLAPSVKRDIASGRARRRRRHGTGNIIEWVDPALRPLPQMDMAGNGRHTGLTLGPYELPMYSEGDLRTPACDEVQLDTDAMRQALQKLRRPVFPVDPTRPIVLPPPATAQIWDIPRPLWDARIAIDARDTAAVPVVFETHYEKVDCGAVATNMCVWAGQPRYFRANQKLLTSSGATRMCNEGEVKHRMHMVVYTPPIVFSDAAGAPMMLLNRSMVQAALYRPNTVADGNARTHNDVPVSRGTAVAPGQDPVLGSSDRRTTHVPGLPGLFVPNTVLVAAMCWEQYGYHLFLCVMNTWVQVARSGVLAHSSTDRVIVVLIKSFSGFFVGGRHDWGAANRSARDYEVATTEARQVKRDEAIDAAPSLVHGAKASSFWPWWSVVVENPEDVLPLPELPRRCFPVAILGSRPSLLTPSMQQAFRAATVNRLRIRRTAPASACASIRVTIIQRGSNFKILNIDEMRVDAIAGIADAYRVLSGAKTIIDYTRRYGVRSSGAPTAQVSPALTAAQTYLRMAAVSGAQDANNPLGDLLTPPSVEVRIVRLEQLAFKEQLQLALDTDVLVGMHGNGLVWTAMQQRASALVELWPSHPYNADYYHLAGRAAVKLFTVKGNASCPRRCPAAFDVRSAFAEVATFLHKYHCDAIVPTLNTSPAPPPSPVNNADDEEPAGRDAGSDDNLMPRRKRKRADAAPQPETPEVEYAPPPWYDGDRLYLEEVRKAGADKKRRRAARKGA